MNVHPFRTWILVKQSINSLNHFIFKLFKSPRPFRKFGNDDSLWNWSEKEKLGFRYSKRNESAYFSQTFEWNQYDVFHAIHISMKHEHTKRIKHSNSFIKFYEIAIHLQDSFQISLQTALLNIKQQIHHVPPTRLKRSCSASSMACRDRFSSAWERHIRSSLEKKNNHQFLKINYNRKFNSFTSLNQKPSSNGAAPNNRTNK